MKILQQSVVETSKRKFYIWYTGGGKVDSASCEARLNKERKKSLRLCLAHVF